MVGFANDARLYRAALGSVAALVVDDHAATLGDVEGVVLELRRRYPHLPFVLCVVGATASTTAQLAFRAHALHLRGVIVDGTQLAASLRIAFSARGDLGADVVEWLQLRGLKMQPSLAHLVGCVFRDVPAHKRCDQLLRATQYSDRTARAQCRKAGVVTPSAWFQLARAIHAVLRLQHGCGSSVLRVALALGYHDQSGLIRQMDHLFGLRPAMTRDLLGWEWLLERWVGRRMSSSSGRAIRTSLIPLPSVPGTAFLADSATAPCR